MKSCPTPSDPTTSAPILDIGEIDRRMMRDGFPELNRLWERFRRSGKQLADLSPDTMTAREDRHARPLFGFPVLAVVLLIFVAWAFTSWLFSIQPFGPTSPSPYFFTFALGAVFLGVMTITIVQRYFCYPFDRLLADRIAWLLAQRNFRALHDAQPRTIAVTEQLSGLQSWDDPSYCAAYQVVEGQTFPLEVMSTNAFVLSVVRDFVGLKNPDTRKFEPGRYFPSLEGGKKTVSAFVKRQRETIAAIKEGSSSIEEMRAALADLSEFVSADSPAGLFLREAQNAIQAEVFTPPGCYRAEIWKRDPWVDLTHQNEFYSSAGLRGIKWMGRGPKGRLAPVTYMDDPSLTCLDLRDRTGRLVRCRLLAVFIGNQPCLFVDGVEGSNQAPLPVIRKAIEDYANHCGFVEVVFNASVHNRTPKRFVRHLVGDLELQAVEIQAVDCSRRQYLDAFSWPLEPWEYVRCEGVALAYRSKTHDGQSLLWWKLFHVLRMNILNITAFVAIGGAITSALINAPWFLIVLAVITIPLLIFHLRSR